MKVRRSTVIFAGLALAGASALGADRPRATGVRPPATQASPQPADNADPPVPMPALPREFSILQTRNVFGSSKGRGGAAAGGGPEAGFVLKGVVQAGSGFTAFVEETGSKQIRQLAVGDSVARGKITSIDLETIEYTMGEAVHRIEVGQDLNGQTPPPPPPPPAAPPAGAEGGPPQEQAGAAQPGAPQARGARGARPNARNAPPPPPQSDDEAPNQ